MISGLPVGCRGRGHWARRWLRSWVTGGVADCAGFVDECGCHAPGACWLRPQKQNHSSPEEKYHRAAVSDIRLPGSSHTAGREALAPSGRYGSHHGTQLETLARCCCSCDDDPRWWASHLDLSSRQRDSTPATTRELQWCLPLRDHLKRAETAEIWCASDTCLRSRQPVRVGSLTPPSHPAWVAGTKCVADEADMPRSWVGSRAPSTELFENTCGFASRWIIV
jgi:hypothetical protein